MDSENAYYCLDITSDIVLRFGSEILNKKLSSKRIGFVQTKLFSAL